VPGTLHLPVAAAMVRLAGVRPGDAVVDPCRGAGTVLVESPVPGVGSDLAGVAAARVNARHRHDIAWLTADARRLTCLASWPALPAFHTLARYPLSLFGQHPVITVCVPC
jgi:tRNA (guanine6-N2)-methyltransferase